MYKPCCVAVLLGLFGAGAHACTSESGLKGASGSGGATGAGGDIGQVGSGGAGGAAACNSLTVEFEAVTPTVLLLVDRSSSMFDLPYASSPTRWQPLYDALMDPVNGPVKQLEGVVRFGFAAYTSNTNGSDCPGLSSVAPALDTYAAIDTAYQPLATPPPFKAETPTGAAIAEAAALLASEPGPKYILLATDGEPDTCQHVDPQCGQDESIRAAQEAYAGGITTIVVGISTDVSAAHLGDLANAGSGEPVVQPSGNFISLCVNGGYAQITADYATVGGNAPFYQPGDQAQLQSQLVGALQGVRECDFTLQQAVSTSEAERCDVTIDGMALTHTTDWTMQSETQLTLTEQACQTLQTADQISIECPCDVLIE
jgi:hypothetical protein